MFAAASTSPLVSGPALTRATRRASRVVAVRAAHPASGPVEVSRREGLIGVAGSIAFLSAGPARAIDVGATAPGFTLPSTGGGSVTLSEVVASNKFTVLYFYNQDFSQGCSIEAERFNQALGDFGSRKAAVVGVSMDSLCGPESPCFLAKHEEFCTAKGLAFKLLSDGDGSVSKSYGADLKIPILGKFSDRQTFLIDDKGTVVGHWLERDGTMANVKTPAHTTQVIAAIDKL